MTLNYKLLFISLIVQCDKILNSLSHTAFIFPQLSCKIIAIIIKHPCNTLHIQSVSQSFIAQSTLICKSSCIMFYVSLRTMFYMVRLTGGISLLEAKVAFHPICVPVIYWSFSLLCSLTVLLLFYQEPEESSRRPREVSFQGATQTTCRVP